MSTIEELQARVAELEAQIASEKTAYDALKVSFDEQAVSLQATTASLQTTRQHNDELQMAQVAALAERDKLVAENSELKVSLSASEAKLVEMSKDNEARLVALQAEIDALKVTVDERQAQIDKLTKECSDSHTDQQMMTTNLRIAQEDVAKANETVETLKIQVEGQRRVHDDLTARLEAQLIEKLSLAARNERLSAKHFVTLKRGELMVYNGEPSDMEFVESKRPWVAEKKSRGVYYLRTGAQGAPEEELARLGYEERSI
jgi:chromosome segregation ATPase